MKVKYSHLSILCSALFFPVGLLVGMLIGLYFKGVNPEDRDITQGLAYLGYILVPTFMVMIGGWLIALGSLLKSRATERDGVTRLAAIIFVAITLLVVTLGMSNKIENNIIDNYKTSHHVNQ